MRIINSDAPEGSDTKDLANSTDISGALAQVVGDVLASTHSLDLSAEDLQEWQDWMTA